MYNRYLKVDDTSIVYSIRYGFEPVNDEFVSEVGNIGDVYNGDGTFTTPEPIGVVQQATVEEQILAENQYQTALLELQMLGGA